MNFIARKRSLDRGLVGRWRMVALAVVAASLFVGLSAVFTAGAEAQEGLTCASGAPVDTNGDGLNDHCNEQICLAFFALDYTGDGVADGGISGCGPQCSNGVEPTRVGDGVWDCTLSCLAGYAPTDTDADLIEDSCLVADGGGIACVALLGVVPIDANLDGLIDSCATCSDNTFHFELVDSTGDGVPNSCFEVFDCDGLAVTIWGTPGADDLMGTEGADVIHLLSGDDTVRSLGGNDIICGGGGRDRIYAGDGADRVYGGNAIDYVWGGDGNDRLFGEGGSDRLKGGNGVDEIEGGSGADRIWGQGSIDYILGQGGQDQIWGGNGNDVIGGNWQSDEIWGGPGRDTISGHGGKDRLYGEDGNDNLNGGENTDTLDGGDGDDSVFGGRGTDTLIGGPGSDLLDGQKHADTCVDIPATTRFVSCATRTVSQGITLQVTAPTNDLSNTIRPLTEFEIFVADVTYSYVTVAVADLGGTPRVQIAGDSCTRLLTDYPDALSCAENAERRSSFGDEVSVGFLDANGRITIPANDGPIRVRTETPWLGDPYCWWSFYERFEPGVTRAEVELAALCA